MTQRSVVELEQEIELLSHRLEEAESALDAIRTGEIDAVFVESQTEQVFTLELPDRPYRLMVEELPQAAATLTGSGTVIYCNLAFLALTGRPLASLLGRPVHETVAPESIPELERMLGGGLTADMEGELCFVRADGTPVSRHFALHSRREGALGLCFVLVDVTVERRYEELRHTQQELGRAVERLSEADRHKDEFLAMLSHELRNPLAPIRNALEILKRSGEVEWSLNVIDRQISTMSRILEDLFDISRISQGKLTLRLEPVFLHEVIESALEASRPLAEAAGHELMVSLPPEPILLQADPVRLMQVFSNLLNNAVRYTETGGHIVVSAETSGHHLLVSVKDNGIGIPPETLPYIFDIFTQSTPAPGQPQGGLGLGLSLVRGVVELHDGSVEARSDGPGRGSGR